MRYLLAVLTCGRPHYLRRTLAEYARFLTPAPAAVYAYDDGDLTPLAAFHTPGWEGIPVLVESGPRVGRCAAYTNLWRATRMERFADIDWLFTVEDDILLLRPLNLRWLADVLNAEPHLAQLALVRAPWHLAELETGGFIPLFEDRYRRRETEVPTREGDGRAGVARWTASLWDWTSSPALLRADLPRRIDWPDTDCDFGIGRRITAEDDEAMSGYWGWGEPWVAHIGLERVEGAMG